MRDDYIQMQMLRKLNTIIPRFVISEMSRLIAASLLALAVVVTARASEGDVEITNRPQPNREITVELISNGTTTMRVLQDRGIVAKTGGRVSQAPQTTLMSRRQSVQVVTSAQLPDGSLPVELRFLDNSTTLRGPDGQEQTLPERASFKGLRLKATIAADGRVRDETVEILGVDPSVINQFRPMTISLLGQLSSMPTLVLSRGKQVPQEMQLKLPVPGLTAPLELKMTTLSELQSVDEGVAHVTQEHSMSFGAAPEGIRMLASGKGNGKLLYDTRTRMLMLQESATEMNFVVHLPDGVLEMRIDSQDSIRFRLSGSPR